MDKAKDKKVVPLPAPAPLKDTDTPPMTDAMRQAMEDQKETKMRKKMGEAYDKALKTYKKGGKVSSASSRGDGCCTKGKTKGRMM